MGTLLVVGALLVFNAVRLLSWGSVIRSTRRAFASAHNPSEIIRVGDPLGPLPPRSADGTFTRSGWEYMSVRLPFTKLALDVVKRHKNRVLGENWKAAEERRWEIRTLRAFNQEIEPNTTYVGFGEWISVTGLFAAQRARTTVMIDPDSISFPVCARMST